jgi:hypothetical protein
MADQFHSARAFLFTLALKSLPVLLAVALSFSGACIGVSAKKGAGAPGAASAVKHCRALRVADDGAIDDLEDNDNQITKTNGREGYWWSAHDPKGSTIDMQIAEPGFGGSELAMHIVGKTVPGKAEDQAWGVLLGVNFVAQDVLLYDASKYAGISFRAKVGSPRSARAVRLKIADVNTHQDAKICKTCWNHFGKDLTLTPEWKEYRVSFSGAEQEPGWGDPRPQAVTPSKLVGLNWGVGPGNDYDIWIDDVAFLDCE